MEPSTHKKCYYSTMCVYTHALIGPEPKKGSNSRNEQLFRISIALESPLAILHGACMLSTGTAEAISVCQARFLQDNALRAMKILPFIHDHDVINVVQL